MRVPILLLLLTATALLMTETANGQANSNESAFYGVYVSCTNQLERQQPHLEDETKAVTTLDQCLHKGCPGVDQTKLTQLTKDIAEASEDYVNATIEQVVKLEGTGTNVTCLETFLKDILINGGPTDPNEDKHYECLPVGGDVDGAAKIIKKNHDDVIDKVNEILDEFNTDNMADAGCTKPK